MPTHSAYIIKVGYEHEPVTHYIVGRHGIEP